MHRWIICIGMCLALAAIACHRDPPPRVAPAEHARPVPCTGPAVPLAPVCDVRLEPPAIRCGVPADVEGKLEQPDLNVVQRATDIFSWQQFIGLHWPAEVGRRGEPAPARRLGDRGPTVWETWKEIDEVFRNDAGGMPIPPEPWDAPIPVPAQCRADSRVLYRTSKVSDRLDDITQPTGSIDAPVTLTSRGPAELTRFEIRLNRVAFEAIVSNRWWDGTVQQRADSVRFPPGASLVKAAWIPIAAGEEERFHAIDACVCDRGAGGAPDGSTCRPRRMGLVGFHIMTKTHSAPQWIWSTFEQIGNVAMDGVHPPTYHDSSCADCPVNQQTPPGVPNQIVRSVTIPSRDPDCADPSAAIDDIAALNRAVQSELGLSPYAHYALVSTQWPLRSDTPEDAPHTVFRVLPEILSNTTLESFIQESSSCMGCHAMARTQRADRFVSADFTFTLNNAFPTPPQPPVLPAPPCDGAEGGSTVCRGQTLASRTYELLPQNAGAKLHCGSCHLDTGRNPLASWWVGMKQRYAGYDGLADRINQCFERSLNGAALCTTGTGGTCGANSDMRALVDYMDWIDAAWRRSSIPKPSCAFPLLAPRVGDAAHGRDVFVQKCAFCHRLDGAGRYQGGVYFRPALWGEASFNSAAGMAQVPVLASFIHGNMPLGSGGELTAQEAWDIAAYIDGQPRPQSSPPPRGASEVNQRCYAQP